MSTNIDQIFELANELYKQKRYEEVVTTYERAFYLEDVAFREARARGQSIKYAIESGGRLIDYGRLQDGEKWGRSLIELKRYEEMLVIIEPFVTLFYPTPPPLSTVKGIALRHLKRFDEALAAIEPAITSFPTYVEAHFEKGIVLANMGDYDGALKAWEMVSKLEPEHKEVYYYKGLVWLHLRENAFAMQYFRLALRFDPENKQAANYLAALERAREEFLKGGGQG